MLKSFPCQLGCQEPAVYTAGQLLEFSLLLWSPNPLALEALGQPSAIEVGIYKSDLFSMHVLAPRTSSRKNRHLTKLAGGRVWREDDGRPGDDEPIPEIKLVNLPESQTAGTGAKGMPGSAASGSHTVKGARSSRMQEVWTEDNEPDERTSAEADSKSSPSTERVPSPTPSLEDIDFDDGQQTDHFLRLQGEVRVPPCSHPSFRYSNMGREVRFSPWRMCTCD